MNKKDLGGALALIGIFAAMLATQTQFPGALEGFLFLGRPLSTALLLGGIVMMYCYKYHASALVAALLSVYLLKTIWTTWPRSDDRRLHLEIGRDQARFNPANSIDLQFANGTATHNLPVLLVQPSFPEMLVFPPSSETQREMNGE
jgi:hypothetical protein